MWIGLGGERCRGEETGRKAVGKCVSWREMRREEGFDFFFFGRFFR